MHASPHSISAVLAAGIVAAVALAGPAAAATSTASTIGELQTALAECATAPNTIVLGADISAPATEVVSSCDSVIDLGTFDLSVRNVVIAAGTALEVTGPTDGTGGTLIADAAGVSTVAAIQTTGAVLRVSGGAIEATSGHHGAAIGGRLSSDGGTLEVVAGEVHAVSTASYAAAIGGGYAGGHGGTVTITGGDVHAEASGPYTVAVGGADGGVFDHGGDGADVTVSGGTLTAVATGSDSQAIGGGDSGLDPGLAGGSGGTLVIGPAATVTAASPHTAFGGGDATLAGNVAGDFGHVDVQGTLLLPSGDWRITDGTASTEVTVSASGRILGTVATPASGAQISGPGSIDNQGVIALEPTTTVTGNNQLVTFSTGDAPVRVFGQSFSAGYRSLPEPPEGTLWNTAGDGSGEWFTVTSSTAGQGTVALYAIAPGSIAVDSDPSALTAVAGEPFAPPASVLAPDGVPLDPQPAIAYSSEDCTLDASGVLETAGECTITATTTVRGVALEQSFTIDVVPGPIVALVLTPSVATVDEGGSVTFTATGQDAFGNGVATDGLVLSSSVATDVIVGLTVTFPTASPHVISATLGGVTAQVTIEVVPAAVPEPAPTPGPDGDDQAADDDVAGLADTGAAPVFFPGVAALGLILLGAVLILARTRRSA